MNKNMLAIWDDEMDKMLVAFQRQAKASLRAMISTARRNGIWLSSEFKEYFLSASNTQIKAAYDEIEAASRLEDQLNSRADSVANMPTAIDANEKVSKLSLIVAQAPKPQSNDLIELLDSDDEARVNRVGVKSETNAIDLDASAVSNSRVLETYDRFDIASMLEDRIDVSTTIGSVNLNERAVLLNPTNVIGSTSRYTEGDDMIRRVSKNRSIQLSDSDGSIVIKAEPTEAISCKSLNNDRSGDQGAIIQIYDSEDEEMPNDDGEARVKVKDNIKPKQEANDDDTSIVLVEVAPRINVPDANVANKGLNGSHVPMHGLMNGEAILQENRARTTLNRESSGYTADRSSSKATRKVGITDKELAQKDQGSKKMKRFKCWHCNYVSSYKCDIKRHMRIHTGEKPYHCGKCKKRFAHHSSHKVHMKVHAREFLFHCPRCFMGFSRKDKKNSHEMSCKTRLYECFLCKQFNTHGITLLKIHMRGHTGEKTFPL